LCLSTEWEITHVTSSAGNHGGRIVWKGERSMKDEPSRGEKRELSKCVIIGDIKKSRDLDNWEHVFGALKSALQETNKRFSDVIVVTFGPTIGDEFQGALTTPEKAFEVCNFIKSRLQIDIYCAIGVGNIEKSAAQEMGMRGSAFYRARDPLQLCKKQSRKVLIKSSDTACLTDDTLNMVLHFIEVLENSWTKRQREVAEYFRLHSDNTYEQLGKHFGLKKQSISDVLIAANWKVIADGNNIVQKLLREMS
jgi:hypothetical protein